MSVAVTVRPGATGPIKPHALVVAENQRARVFGGEEEGEGGSKARAYEEQNWRNCVLDLHRVLSVAKDLFFVLEHNNEALLRVAVEIVCCEEAQRAIWWTEEWFEDDIRREWFRQVVADKLDLIMGKGSRVHFSLEDASADKQNDDYADLARKLEKYEEHIRIIEMEKKMTDMKLREAEDSNYEIQNKVAHLEKTTQHLREELRNKKPDPSLEQEKEALAKQLEEAQQQVKLAEEQRNKVQERLKVVESEFESRASKWEEEKVEMRRKQEEEMMLKEKKAAEVASELSNVREQLKRATMVSAKIVEKPKEEPPPPVKDTAGDAKMKAMVKKFETEKNARLAAEKHAEEMKGQLAGLEATLEGVTKREIPGLNQEKREAESRAAEALKKVERLEETLAKADGAQGLLDGVKAEYEKKLQKMSEDLRSALAAAAAAEAAAAAAAAAKSKKAEPEPAPPPPPPINLEPKPEPKPEPKAAEEEPKIEIVEKIVEKEVTKVVEKVIHTGISEEDLNQKIEALDKAKQRIREQKAENGELLEKIEALEAKNLKLLKMLHEIKEQLRRVTELAEKKGAGNLISSILEESKVSETLDSEEYTCFNRLYDDAVRRQENQRKLQEQYGIATDRRPQRRLVGGANGGRRPSGSGLSGPVYMMDESSEGMWSGEAQAQPWGGPGGPPRGAPFDQTTSSTASNATLSPTQAHMQYAAMQHSARGHDRSREPSVERREGEPSSERREGDPAASAEKEHHHLHHHQRRAPGSAPRRRPSSERREGETQFPRVSRPTSASRTPGPVNPMREQVFVQPKESNTSLASLPSAPVNPMREQVFIQPKEIRGTTLGLPPAALAHLAQSQTWPDMPGWNFDQASYWPEGPPGPPPGSRGGRPMTTMARPFGLARSHGLLPDASDSVSMRINSSHGSRANTSHGHYQGNSLSAMTMDRFMKDRSPSADGRPRRRLIESRSTPDVRREELRNQEQSAGLGLPPLARKEAEEMIREAVHTWPGLTPGNVRMMMADSNQSSRAPSRQKQPFTLSSLTSSKKKSPRVDWSKNHEDYLVTGHLPKSGNTFGAGGSLAGWMLHGHGASHWFEGDNVRVLTPAHPARELVENL